MNQVTFTGAGAIALAAFMSAGGTSFANDVPWVGDKIVIDSEGVYTLEYPAEATGVEFKAPGVIDGAGLTLKAPAVVSGTGSLLAPLSGSDGLTVDSRFPAAADTYIQDDVDTLLWSGHSLFEVAYSHAKIGGSWRGATLQALPLAFEKTADDTAIMQYQVISETLCICFKVRFTQQSDGIYGRVLWARYTDDLSLYGTVWTDDTPYWGKYSGPYSPSTICIRDFWMGGNVVFAGPLPEGNVSLSAESVTLAPAVDMIVSNVFAGTVESLCFIGAKKDIGDASPMLTLATSEPNLNTIDAREITFDGLDVTVASAGWLPRGKELVLTNAVNLVFDYPYSSQAALSGDSSLVVSKGCKATFTQEWMVGANASVSVDGGEIQFNGLSYCNNITLKDGGRLTGRRIATGYSTAGYVRTQGEETCVIDCALCSAKDPGLDSLVFTLDTEADLRLTSGFGGYGAMVGLTYAKRGPGTLSLEDDGKGSGEGSNPGPFVIYEGKFLLGGDGVIAETNRFTLAGGSLDVGSYTNTLGELVVTTNSTLCVGSGLVEFKDSSLEVWAEDAVLNIVGDDSKLSRGRVRFMGSGLTEKQVSAIRYNGKKRVYLDGNGYLRTKVSGFIAFVR